MKCYIVLYSHRHGSDAWVRFTADDAMQPNEEDEIRELGDTWEGEIRDEYLEIFGPYPVPALSNP